MKNIIIVIVKYKNYIKLVQNLTYYYLIWYTLNTLLINQVIMFNRYWINFKKDNQKTRVLKILQYYKWKEVNVWKLMLDSKVCHYTQSIMELRRDWYVIKNHIHRKWNILHSSYMLIK